jgi:hypothetical protein
VAQLFRAGALPGISDECQGARLTPQEADQLALARSSLEFDGEQVRQRPNAQIECQGREFGTHSLLQAESACMRTEWLGLTFILNEGASLWRWQRGKYGICRMIPTAQDLLRPLADFEDDCAILAFGLPRCVTSIVGSKTGETSAQL